eukprot:1157409-Pelagomonas_calceolata.AAC.5
MFGASRQIIQTASELHKAWLPKGMLYNLILTQILSPSILHYAHHLGARLPHAKHTSFTGIEWCMDCRSTTAHLPTGVEGRRGKETMSRCTLQQSPNTNHIQKLTESKEA